MALWRKVPQWVDESLPRNWYQQITAYAHNLPNKSCCYEGIKIYIFKKKKTKPQIADLTIQA